MTLPASTLLLFKTKIEEAVSLVPEMVAGEKLKAVQFWNMVSERLQDIVNSSAADINALAMKMAKDGVEEELPVLDGDQANNTKCSESPKDFIVSPSFVPAGDYEENSAEGDGSHINHSIDNHDTRDEITNFGSEPNLKSETPAKILDSEKILIPDSGDTSHSLPSSPTAIDSYTIEVTELSSSAKENLPLLKSELNLTNSKKGCKRKRTALKKMSKKLLHRKLKSDVQTSCKLSKLKRKDLLAEYPIQCSADGNVDDPKEPPNKAGLLENVVDENQKDDEQPATETEIVLIQPDCSNVLKAFKSPPFTCEWCNMEFYSASTLTSHQWTHVKPYACAECTSRFSTKGNLIVHQRSHTGEKPFRCDQCDACFSTNSNLRRHSKTHTGEKPWECSQCGKRYTEKKSLKVHLRNHTGEKPYQCPICLKHFTQTGILQTHMTLHLDQKAHLCDICGKSFRQRSQLRLHKLRHDGVKKYNCNDCTAEFLTKGDLERHKRVHTGERPFICDLCGKTYTRQQSLNEHMNRHYGLKPYECKYCNRKFAEMSACYKHIKRHESTKKNKDEVHPVQIFQSMPCEGEMTFEVCSDVKQLQTIQEQVIYDGEK